MKRILNAITCLAWLHAAAHIVLAMVWIVFCLLAPSAIETAAGGIALNIVCGILWAAYCGLCVAGCWLVEVRR